MKGPDLGKVGEDPKHDVEWFQKYIVDPRSQKPDAKMPGQKQLKEEELKAISEFLTTLKSPVAP
jgi:cbb3-type cytochrome oxidase cytochrome c subunit